MRKTLEQFVEDARKVHGDKYCYDHVIYTNNSTKVTILCPEHGPFSQLPVRHTSGKTGCPRCAVEKRKQTNIERYGSCGKKPSLESTIKRQATNLERYGCKEAFQSDAIKKKRQNALIVKYGVPHAMMSDVVKQKRSINNTQKWGVKAYKQKHMMAALSLLDDPVWLINEYVTKMKNAYQIADELGVERTTVLNRLKCYNIGIRPSSPYSQKCVAWLEQIMENEHINIKHAANGGEYRLPGTNIRVDGFCAETNTVYEFYGDYWHGNPAVFNPALFNTQKNKTMEELYNATIDREQHIRSLGYNLIVIWERDFVAM